MSWEWSVSTTRTAILSLRGSTLRMRWKRQAVVLLRLQASDKSVVFVRRHARVWVTWLCERGNSKTLRSFTTMRRKVRRKISDWTSCGRRNVGWVVVYGCKQCRKEIRRNHYHCASRRLQTIASRSQPSKLCVREVCEPTNPGPHFWRRRRTFLTKPPRLMLRWLC